MPHLPPPAPVQATSQKSTHSIYQSHKAAAITSTLQMETLQSEAQRDLRALSTERQWWNQDKALLTPAFSTIMCTLQLPCAQLYGPLST